MKENYPIKISEDGKVFCQGKECRLGVLFKRAMDKNCDGDFCPLSKAVRVTAACIGYTISAQFNANMDKFRDGFKDLLDEKYINL